MNKLICVLVLMSSSFIYCQEQDKAEPVNRDNEVKNVCNSLNKILSCCAKYDKDKPCDKEKIGLITYDPKDFYESKFSAINGQSTTNPRPSDSDCYLVESYLENKGFCVEGFQFEHSQSLKDALNKNPSLRSRYSYIANITHGDGGMWLVYTTKCEAAATKACRNRNPQITDNEKFLQCLEDEKSSVSNKASCPCYADYKKYVDFKSNYDKISSENVTKVYADGRDVASELSKAYFSVQNAVTAFQRRARDSKNVEYYDSSQDISVYGKLVKSGTTIFSVSCKTAKNSEELRNTICSTAPEGTSFNLANTSTEGSCVVYGDKNKKDRFEKSTNKFCQIQNQDKDNYCWEDFVNEVCEIGKLDPNKPYILQPMLGNFSCWTCLKQTAGNSSSNVAIKAPDCSRFDFPKGVVPNAPDPDKQQGKTGASGDR